MRKLFAVLCVFVGLLGLCACQQIPDIAANPTTAGQQDIGTKPSTHPSAPTSATNSIPPAGETQPTLPQNCKNGHTFPNEAHYCAVCGMDYYATTLEFALSDDGTYYAVTGFGTCKRTTVIVPENYNGLPVERVNLLITPGVFPFDRLPESFVTHVVLPESIKIIDGHAFYGYHSLVSINIPNGITRIEESTFQACKSLVSLNLPESVTYIGKNAFASCGKLKDFHLPKGVTELGEAAFAGCESLEELNIPEEMTEIPRRLVYGCVSLKNITYGEGITKIGSNAFTDCAALQSFTIGEKVTQIGSGAFKGCKSLTSIIIPESVSTIGIGAFEGCVSLTTITIPDAVTAIEQWTFHKCENLETVVLGKNIKSFGHSVFNECPKLKAIYFCGTQTDWELITMWQGPSFVEVTNPQFENVTVYFYSETQPTEPGHYWHYVDGVPTPWET